MFTTLTNGAGEGHDDALPERVDGRVGDLCEELLEVLIDKGLELRQAGQGRVVAHGAQGLFPGMTGNGLTTTFFDVGRLQINKHKLA